jgi:hypothetical protein
MSVESLGYEGSILSTIGGCTLALGSAIGFPISNASHDEQSQAVKDALEEENKPEYARLEFK